MTNQFYVASIIQDCEEEAEIYIPPVENVVGRPINSDAAFIKLESLLNNERKHHESA